MPAILAPEHIDQWLTDTNEEAKAVLQPYPAGMMVAWPVSRRVNSPKNNDAALVEKAE